MLALIMFGVGLAITPADVAQTFRYPKVFLSALAAQMIGLPIIAALLHLVTPLSDEFKVGFIILAASPGGATSGFLTYLWRGNVALSLSITSVNSFLTLFSIPIVVNLGLMIFFGSSTDIHLPFWDTVGHIFLITIIPAGLGVVVRQRAPDWADQVAQPAKFIMLVLLALVFVFKVFAGESQGGAGLTWADFVTLSPFALIQNLLCLSFGYFFLLWIGATHSSRLTAAMESGVQNTTLAFLIAGNLLNNESMVKPALVYSMFSFWTACLFAYFSNKIVSQ
ncbi:MAG: bile acid:sodium symporter family protein [Saprospiraceae bacterium]